MYSIQSDRLKRHPGRRAPLHPSWRAHPDTSSAIIQRKSPCACGGTCPKCRGDSGIGDGSAKENCNGLPRPLKAGLEAFSGIDLSGVRVHNNSAKPAQLNALAYTQGQDIHVAPGQEKYLPHEGWHVVQQMQGRVTSTMRENGVSINNDVSLEREADVMGAKALQATPATNRLARTVGMPFQRSNSARTLQRQGPAVPATRSPQEEYVQDAIRFLQAGAAMYQGGRRVDQAGVVRQLDGWMTMLQTAITFNNAGPTGPQVGTTAERLRLAYQAAVSALMNAAVSHLGQTLPALHEQHAHRIHAWAWPVATRPGRTLSASAQAIITNAQDTSVPINQRAIAAVRAIISTYYPTEVGLFRVVEYDAGDPGLTTSSPSRMVPTPTAQAKLLVGSYFVTHTTRTGFARRVLQVAHELEHVRQQRRGQGGGNRSDLREFLAFTREALAQERTGTGRVSHSTRVSLIDAALRRYYRLSANQRATYVADRDRLLVARSYHAQRSGNTHPAPPGPATTGATP